MKVSFPHLACLVGIVALADPRPGLADNGERTCKLEHPVGTCQVQLHEDEPVSLHFDSAILELNEPEQWGVTPELKPGSDTIMLTVMKGAKPEYLAGTLIVATRDYTVHIPIRAAPSADKADKVVNVMMKSRIKALQRAVLAEAKLLASNLKVTLEKQHYKDMKAKDAKHKAEMKAKDVEHAAEMKTKDVEHKAEMKAKDVEHVAEMKTKDAENQAVLKKHKEEAQERAKRDKLKDQSKSLLDQIDGIPACATPLAPDYETSSSKDAQQLSLRLLTSCVDADETHLLVPFEVASRDPQPFRPNQLQVESIAGKLRRPRVSFLEDSSPPEGSGIIASVGMDKQVRGVIAIEVKEAVSIDKLEIKLAETMQGGRWLHATVNGWNSQRSIVVAAPASEFLRRIREQEAREARGRQIIVGPRVSYGGCWLADAPGSSNLEATDCTMLGVGLTKGISEMLAFEVEGMGGWTGETATGSAKFGRVTLAGRLRFGQFTIPYARVGIGVQAGSVDGSSEFGGLLAAGGGVDKRLGNNVLLGIGAYYEKSLNIDNRLQQSFGLGVHLSVGWTRKAADLQ